MAVPKDLRNLELYKDDRRLCAKWDDLYREWQRTYPNLDVLEEVEKAHMWELANPRKQKKDRPRFLNNWLNRGAGRPPLSLGEVEERGQRSRTQAILDGLKAAEDDAVSPEVAAEYIKNIRERLG